MHVFWPYLCDFLCSCVTVCQPHTVSLYFYLYGLYVSQSHPVFFSLCLCIFVIAFMLANLDDPGWWGCEEVSGCLCHLSRHCSTPSLTLTGSPLSFLNPLCSQDPPTCSLLGPHPSANPSFPAHPHPFGHRVEVLDKLNLLI